VKKNFTHIYYAAPGNVKGKKHIYAEIIIFLLHQTLDFVAITIPKLIHCSLERGCERGSFAAFHNLIIPSPLSKIRLWRGRGRVRVGVINLLYYQIFTDFTPLCFLPPWEEENSSRTLATGGICFSDLTSLKESFTVLGGLALQPVKTEPGDIW
jgi:hypothetical protein